jgi:hypothetical protein
MARPGPPRHRCAASEKVSHLGQLCVAQGSERWVQRWGFEDEQQECRQSAVLGDYRIRDFDMVHKN